MRHGTPRWTSWLARGVVGRPRLALLVAAVLAAFAALAATQLESTSPTGLLARDGSDVGAATLAQERAFGGEPIVVVVEGDLLGTTLTPAVLPRMLGLERELAELDGVRTVIGPATFVDLSVSQMFDVVEAELGPAAERADKAVKKAVEDARQSGRFTEQELNDIADETRLRALGPLRDQYEELFVRFGSTGLPSLTNSSFVAQLVLGASPEPKPRFAWLFPDREHALIVLRPEHGLADERIEAIGRETAARVRAARLPGVATSVAGAPLVAAAATRTVADELVRLFPAVLGGMVVALLLGLGRRNRAVHLLLPAIAAVLLTAGLSWPLGLGFSAATLAALPVVLGLAVDYAIQLQARYWQERRAGRPPPEAALAALRRVGPTLAIAGGAMAAGFLTLVLSPVPLVGRLGLTLALGVACSLLCLLTIVPATLVAFDRPGAEPAVLRLPRLRVGPRLRFWALAAAIGVTLAGLALSSGTEVESDLRRLADRDMPELRSLEALQEELGTGGHLRVAVEGDVTSPEALEWMRRAEERVLGLGPGLTPGPNLATVLASGGQDIPDREAIVRLLGLIPEEFVSGILGEDRTRAELSFGIPLRSAGEQAALIGRMQDVLRDTPEGLDAQVAGLQALSAAAVDDLQDERPWLLLLAALVVFLLLWAATRDPRAAAIPLAPALLAAGATALVIEIAGLRLSPLTAGLDPLVLAVGVEFGLLLRARYDEERRGGHGPAEAARRARAALATPVAAAAGTVALGFAVLVLSRLPVLQQFGAVAAIELVLCVAAALLLVPALSAAADRRRVGVPADDARDTGEAAPGSVPSPRQEVPA